jgi:hypothetical protein
VVTTIGAYRQLAQKRASRMSCDYASSNRAVSRRRASNGDCGRIKRRPRVPMNTEESRLLRPLLRCSSNLIAIATSLQAPTPGLPAADQLSDHG